jgi:hypothetical protein
MMQPDAVGQHAQQRMLPLVRCLANASRRPLVGSIGSFAAISSRFFGRENQQITRKNSGFRLAVIATGKILVSGMIPSISKMALMDSPNGFRPAWP